MKIVRKAKNDNNPELYDNYLSIDWSKDNATISIMRSQSGMPHTEILKPELKQVKEYIKKIKGSKILTIEETTTSHWLYVELKESVNKIIICDPYRNKLIGEGAKTDKIDSQKLCQLLRGGFLKEIYHSLDEDYKIRKLMSSYEDIIKAGVRVKNQNAALYLAEGLNHKKDRIDENNEVLDFINKSQSRSIELYKEEKKNYVSMFEAIKKRKPIIKKLCNISGIGLKTAMIIYSKVIDAGRFENKYKYWCYCGLVKNEKWSGGKLYGKRNPRCCRQLKSAYKIAALAAITHKNDIREYYEHLLKQNISADRARNKIARYIAKVSYAVMKNGSEYRPYEWRERAESKPAA